MKKNVDIRALIASKGLSHKDFAKLLGISPITLSHWLASSELSDKQRTRIMFVLEHV